MARVFVSYSYQDESYRVELDKHLALLKRQGVIDVWSGYCIQPGEEFDPAMGAALEASDLILLLVSSDFMHSGYGSTIELKRAMERHGQGSAIVVPVILRSCDWHSAPFGRLQALPTDAKPVAKWHTPDEAFLDIVQQLRGMLTSQDPAQPSPVASMTPGPAATSDPARMARSSSLAPAAAGAIMRPANLPYLSLGELFKGREAPLQALAESLGPVPDAPGSSALPVAARVLHGLGGVGKTRLALEYAWQHQKDYTALLFVGADRPEALQRNLAALCACAVLDLPEQAEMDEAGQRAAVLAWLRQHPGWLLILDNIDSEEAARAAEDLLPQLSGGHVLLTGRLAHWSGGLGILQVDVLSPEAAVDFLLARTDTRRRKHPKDPATARTLASELGHLALALEQAGAYIAQRRQSLVQYLKQWREQRERVLTWLDPRLMNYPKSVATTWQTSFEQLSASARSLLQRLAWLAPDPVPESLMDVAVPGSGATGTGIEADPLEALTELECYSLVTRAAEAHDFSVHRLVQEVTRLGQDAEAARASLSEALQWIADAFAGDPDDVHSWSVLDPLAPHARMVAAWADGSHIADPTAWLMNQLGVLLLQKALHAEAERLIRRALAIDEANFGVEHPTVARALNNLALLLKATGRLAEAESLLSRALAIDEASFGAGHPEVAIDLNNLAQMFQATDRLAEAESLTRRALAIEEASLGPEHPRLAHTLNNLAVLLQTTHRLVEAEPLMRRALAIDEASFGVNHPTVAVRLNNLAMLLKAANRLAEAEPLMRRGLKISLKILGASHFNSQFLRKNYIFFMQTNGWTEEAIERELQELGASVGEAGQGLIGTSFSHSLDDS